MDSFARCRSAFLDHPDFDALVFPGAYSHPIATMTRYNQVKELSARYPDKVICPIWFPEWLEGPGSREYETDEHMAMFRSTERCMLTLAAWHRRADRVSWR